MDSKPEPTSRSSQVRDDLASLPAPHIGVNGKHSTSRSVDRAKMNIRRGSKHLRQLLSTGKADDVAHLDLETFYQARLRRRTHLAQEITGSMMRVTVPPTEPSPTKARGIMMTLSPGEEYEQYQKVDAASKLQQGPLVRDEPSQIDNVEEAAAEAEANATSKVARSSVRVAPVDRKRQREEAQKKADGPRTFTMQQLVQNRSARAAQVLLVRKVASRMIDPHGRFRLGWDLMSISFIFYNAVVLPFQASFNTYEGDEGIFDYFLDGFFLFDILVTLNTAIEVDGSIRYDRRLVAKSYLTSWFVVDLVAALPYGYLFPDSSASVGPTLRKSLKLLRLVRLLRLFRLSRILRRVQNAVFIRSTLSSLVKYILMVMFVSHWFSCIFHAIAANNSGKNWISENKLQDPLGTRWDRYVAALYFAVMTLATIGFGDVSGTNADERVFAIFAMIIGGGIFAYGITNIVELVSSLTIQETRFRQKMDEVNEYMAARELPMKLRMEIREFFHNTRLSRESKLNAEQQVLGELSSKLRSKIALCINDQFLRKFPFFTGSDPNFLMELALNMRMIHFAPLEDIIIEGEIGHEMFFIFRGAVEVLRQGKQIGILGENQYFGEMAILSTDNRRRATVRTLCFCELRMLSRNRFLEALTLFPAMQTKMAQVAKSRLPPEKAEQAIIKMPTASASIMKVPDTPDDHPIASEPGSHQLPPPKLAVPRQVSSNGLRIGTAVTSAVARLQQNERRSAQAAQNHLPARNTTSARLGSTTRRPSNSGGTGISASMALMLSEASGRLEEVSRRQEMLVSRILKLQSALEEL